MCVCVCVCVRLFILSLFLPIPFPQWTTDQDILTAMTEIGVNDFQEVKFFENRANGQSKGFCAISMGSENSMRLCMDRLPKKTLHGQVPVVTLPTKQALNQFESLQKTRPNPPPQNAPRGPMQNNMGGPGGCGGNGGGPGMNMNHMGGGPGGPNMMGGGGPGGPGGPQRMMNPNGQPQMMRGPPHMQGGGPGGPGGPNMMGGGPPGGPRPVSECVMCPLQLIFLMLRSLLITALS